MPIRMLLHCLLICIPLFSIAQIDTITSPWSRNNLPEATETKVQLSLQVFDMRNRPVTGLNLWFVQERIDEIYSARTDEQGKVYLLLPKGTTFTVNSADEAGFETIKTINRGFVRSRLAIGYSPKTYKEIVQNDTIYQEVPEEQMPTHSRILLKLTVTDFEGLPHDEEQLFFACKGKSEVYVAQTNKEGKAFLMLPKGDSLFMHTLFERNITDLYFKDDKMAGILNLRYKTIGSKAILARKAEREREASRRDSMLRIAKIRDSLDFLGGAREGKGLLNAYSYGTPFSEIKSTLNTITEETRSALEADQKYFEKAGYELNSALYRHKELWANKVIVSDVTGSMSPYLDQILLWHALAIVPGENNRYLFFNDGDDKSSAEKKIGETGGIYACEDREMEKIMQVMKRSMDAGWGGESVENDIEALIEGTRMMGEGDELILLADNYSNVRDLELLAQLNVPVRVVLAGVDYGVNEEYLHLAYMTGGSIHTLEEDIFHLTRLNDGEIITVGDYRYRVNAGTFIQIKD